MGGQVDHLLLAGDLGIGLGLLDLLGAQVRLDHTGGVRVGGGLVSLGLQLGLCQLQLVVALGNSGLGFDLLLVRGHGGGSLRAGDVALGLGLGDGGALFHKLLLLDADGFNNAVVVAHGVHGVLDVLHVEGHDLQAHLGQVGACVLHDADGHLLAVCQDLVHGHLGHDLTQVALQHIVDLFIDVRLVHAEEVRDRGLLAGIDVLADVVISGVADLLVRDGGVLAVDLNGDDAVEPEGDALLGFNARFRRFHVDFQQAHVQAVCALHNGQHKDAAPADDLRAGEAEACHDDGLGRRGLLVAEKTEGNDGRGNSGSNNESHTLVPPSEHIGPQKKRQR